MRLCRCRLRLTGSLVCPLGTLEQVTSALLEILRWGQLCLHVLRQMSAHSNDCGYAHVSPHSHAPLSGEKPSP